jgi:hypothetical protein
VRDLVPLYGNDSAIHVEDYTLGSLTLAADVVLDSSRLTELEAVGARLRADGPSTFLLWENSD